MCGIFGYIGKDSLRKTSVYKCVEGLKKLEYRGYDSAGIAGIFEGSVQFKKIAGRINLLEELLLSSSLDLDCAIGHTRWATHGTPTSENAHPHFDEHKTLALVHNGIIENHHELQLILTKEGVQFSSQTDSEVVAQLIAYYYEGNIIEAVRKTLSQLEGSFAIAVTHKDFPDQIIAAARECPLVIGMCPDRSETFLSSDPNAFARNDLNLLYLGSNEVAILQCERVEVYNSSGMRIERPPEHLTSDPIEISKEGFEHFMLKEIFEQPRSIEQTMLNRFIEEFGTSNFEELTIDSHELKSIHRILILACGTSWHAGCIAAGMLENLARIPVEAEIASEFRYTNPIVSEDTLVIAISQSGETADTIAAVREAKAKGAKILSICNVRHSTLTRESHSCLFLRAGPEISVCSTKAFTSQLTLLSLFTLYLARLSHLGKDEGKKFLSALQNIPGMVSDVLSLHEKIQQLSKKYAHHQHFFFLGRQYMYPTSLEAALKLKEITYLNASGYPAGEMKHGPLALIDETLPTIAMCGNRKTYDKLLSNLREVKARNGPILAFAFEGSPQIEEIADDVLFLPSIIDELACIPFSVAAQLFAYYIAKERGANIDHPRNLAKSVTVE